MADIFDQVMGSGNQNAATPPAAAPPAAAAPTGDIFDQVMGSGNQQAAPPAVQAPAGPHYDSLEPAPTTLGSLWQQITGPIRESTIGRAFHLDTITEAQKQRDPSLNDDSLVRFEEALPHPDQPGAIHGAAKFASGLTTPTNLGIMAATSGLGAIESTLGKAALSKLVSLGFSAQMIAGGIASGPKFAQAVQAGRWDIAREIMAEVALSAVMAKQGVSHAMTPEVRPWNAQYPTEQAPPAPEPQYTSTGQPVGLPPPAPVAPVESASPQAPVQPAQTVSAQPAQTRQAPATFRPGQRPNPVHHPKGSMTTAAPPPKDYSVPPGFAPTQPAEHAVEAPVLGPENDPTPVLGPENNWKGKWKGAPPPTPASKQPNPVHRRKGAVLASPVAGPEIATAPPMQASAPPEPAPTPTPAVTSTQSEPTAPEAANSGPVASTPAKPDIFDTVMGGEPTPKPVIPQPVTPEQPAGPVAGNVSQRDTETPAKPASGEPETGPHGPIHHEFAGKPREALAWARANATGFAAGAIPHPESKTGIGLTLGKPGDPDNEYRGGYGVSHIDAKHKGWLDQHIDEITSWPVVKRFYDKSGKLNRVNLSDGKQIAAVSLDWSGKAHPDWLLSAFTPAVEPSKTPVSATSIRVDETPQQSAGPTPPATGDSTAPLSTEGTTVVPGTTRTSGGETSPSPNSDAPDSSIAPKEGEVNTATAESPGKAALETAKEKAAETKAKAKAKLTGKPEVTTPATVETAAPEPKPEEESLTAGAVPPEPETEPEHEPGKIRVTPYKRDINSGDGFKVTLKQNDGKTVSVYLDPYHNTGLYSVVEHATTKQTSWPSAGTHDETRTHQLSDHLDKDRALAYAKGYLTGGMKGGDTAIWGEPSADRFDAISKQLTDIQQGQSSDPRATHNTRVELEREQEHHRPAAEAKAQAEIDREKGKSVKAAAPLPANVETEFAARFRDNLADARKRNHVDVDPQKIKETVLDLTRQLNTGTHDYASATVGDRHGRIDRKTVTEGRGNKKVTKHHFQVILNWDKQGKQSVTHTFDNAEAAIYHVTEALHSLGVKPDYWDDYRYGATRVAERLVKTGELLSNTESAMAASDAAAQALGQPKLSGDIYHQAFGGGWKSAPANMTFADVAKAYAESLPRNESALLDQSSKPSYGQNSDPKYALLNDTPEKNTFARLMSSTSSREFELDRYQGAAKGIAENLKPIRRMIATAKQLNGGTTPRIEESEKFFDAVEKNVAANLAAGLKAEREAAAKEIVDVREKVRPLAEAYSKFGEATWPDDAQKVAGVDPDGWMRRYAQLAGLDAKPLEAGKGEHQSGATWAAVMKDLGIEPKPKPKRIQVPLVGKNRLVKAEVEALEKAQLGSDQVAHGDMGVMQKLQARGWVNAEYRWTPEGEAAVYSYRMDREEAAAGKPFSKYEGKPTKTIAGMGDTRFGTEAKAWNLVDGEVWHTNGHGAWLGEFPKNWTPRNTAEKGPDLSRVTDKDAKKFPPVKPVGFYVTQKGDKPFTTIVFDNGSGMDSTLYEYTRGREGDDLKWRQAGPKNALYAYNGEGKLVAVVMPLRLEVPENLKPFLNPELEAKLKDAKKGERGGISPQLLTLGASEFWNQDVAPAFHAAARMFAGTADDILKVLAPQFRSPQAYRAGLILRHRAAELARAFDQARDAVKAAKKAFDKLPAAENYDFIHRMETGAKQFNPDLDTIAATLRKLLDERRAEVQALGTGKLRGFYKDYFPHIWNDPRKAAQVFAALIGRRPLEAGKNFLKRRTHITFEDGLKAGLTPVSDNPIDLVMLKLHEMDRYIMAHRVLNDWKAQGLARFVDARDTAAQQRMKRVGWRQINDPIAVVYGQSVQQITEFPNEGIWNGLQAVANALGLKQERGFLNLHDAIGRANQATRTVKTLHGTAEDVLAHEIGHQIDWLAGSGDRFIKNYPDAASVARLKAAYATLKDKASTPDAQSAARKELASLKGAIAQRKEFARQLRALADLRGGDPSYTHKREEKMALLAEMWVGSRELFKRTAPKVFAEWKQFLDANPKLHALRDIEGNTEVLPIAQPYDVGGLVIKGHWWAPEGAARILDNYLSPGLRSTSGFYRLLLAANNLLNQAQLGLSAFHLGFTSLDASVSKGALAIEQVLRGQPLAAVKTAAGVPVAPITTFITGNKLLKEWHKAGSQGPAIAKIVDGLVLAGGRAHMDEMYQTRIGEKMRRAFYTGNFLGGLVRAPFAGVEAISNIIMREIVPRQKLGVFADLARFELSRLPQGASEEQVAETLAKVWDSVENRMGQMTYDNLFWDRVAKDLAMLNVRSVGWNLGTIREIGGAGVDAVRIPIQLGRGKTTWERVNLHRLSYVVSLALTTAVIGAIYQYLKTGKGPQEPKDYFFPKTGELDEAGRPQRVSMPTYVKDVYHYATEPGATLANKISPLDSLFAEMVRNEDFYHTQIRNEDDPLIQQMLDVGKHVARSAEPFGFRNLDRAIKMDAPLSQRVQQFVGITPAPGALEKSRAELLASKLQHDSIPAGARTKEQAARSQEEAYLRRLARLHRPTGPEIGKALQKGTLTVAEARRALNQAQMDPLMRTFKSLGLDQALKVWDKASSVERKRLRPLLFQKGKTLAEKSPVERAVLAPKFRAALSQQ